MTVPLFSIDGQAFKSSMQKMLMQLDAYGKAGASAVTIAQVEYAEKLLKEMKANITHKNGSPTYFLARSGHVSDPRKEGEWVVVEILWDAPYANIQDKGGLIRPKHVSAADRYNPKRETLSRFTATGRPRNLKETLRGHLGRLISRKKFNTARLFVPLRPGVKAIKDPVARRAAGYIMGVDFVLARQVSIKGSKFITMVLNKYRPHFARDVGARAEKIWTSMVEAMKR